MRQAVAFFEAGDLRFAVGGDDDGLIHAFVDAGFEEERYVVDYYGSRIFFRGLSCESRLFACHARMDDSFQRAAFGRMAKNDRAKRAAIEAAVRIEDGVAERLDDLPPGRLARLNDIACQLIGIDDHCAAAFEHLGDGTFPGRHTACESDENHRGENSMGRVTPQESPVDFSLVIPVRP